MWVIAFVRLNSVASAWFDRKLPSEYQIDGNARFRQDLADYIAVKDKTVYDIGGGSRPFFTIEEKAANGLHIVGVDISEIELKLAPTGAYDEIVVADITRYRGSGDADLVICQSALEHVDDADAAVSGIASILKRGGRAVVFLPCRNAVFARLNMVLPERLKRSLLARIYPETDDGHSGFPAFYDRATPREYAEMAERHGLDVAATRIYWRSSYFRFLFPLHVAWRGYQMLRRAISGDQACETFAMVLESPPVPKPPALQPTSPRDRRRPNATKGKLAVFGL